MWVVSCTLFPISSGNVYVTSIGNLFLGGNVNSESTPVCERKQEWSLVINPGYHQSGRAQ